MPLAWSETAGLEMSAETTAAGDSPPAAGLGIDVSDFEIPFGPNVREKCAQVLL